MTADADAAIPAGHGTPTFPPAGREPGDVPSSTTSTPRPPVGRPRAREGSSAERQEDTYREAMLDGASERDALRAVVDLIIAETECTGGEAQGAPDSSP